MHEASQTSVDRFIEALWLDEDGGGEDPMASVEDSFSQLDMLLQEIRSDGPLEP